MKFSVIIPVYNSVTYLSETLNSILSQTYDDYEVILVDDGSTDGSELICDSYVSEDLRFKVIHKTNGGVSSARNTGLNYISGEWVVFLDSDDMLHKSTLAILKRIIETDSELDVVQFGVTRIPFKNDLVDLSKFEVKSSTPEEYCKLDHYNVSIGGSAFRAETIKKYSSHFDERMKLAEDQVFVFQMLQSSRKCLMLDAALYYYRKNENSATNQSNPNEMVVTIEALEKYKTIYPLSVAQFDSIILLFLYNLILDSSFTNRTISSLLYKVQIKDISKSLSGPRLLYHLSKISSLFAVTAIRVLNLVRK